MPLNPSKGNMYDWITHTWNPIKGRCYHDCSYCYMKRWGKQNPVHLDEKDLNTDHGQDNFIFVGSSCDMFAQDIPEEWIRRVLEKCPEDNQYLFQTKNPENIRRILTYQSRVCVTIETNRIYDEIMRNSPQPYERVYHSMLIRQPLYITIEPIMDFDMEIMVRWMDELKPVQINIGADSGNNHLPEPSGDKVRQLIRELIMLGLKVKKKANLNRLLQ